MDLMDDEDLRKSVLSQMSGEADDVTADALKKPKGPVKGVDVTITISPKSEEDLPAEGEKCDIPGCEDPMHDHSERDAAPEGSDYISQLLKKMG